METKTGLVVPSLVAAASLAATAWSGAEELYCHWAHAHLAPPTSSDHRKYAPDRAIDLLHLALDVTPNWTERSVAGTATLRFKPIAKPLGELSLDGVDLAVEAVSSTEKILGSQATDKQVIVTFAEPIPPDREAIVTIRYHARPEKGLYFRTPEMGYRPEDMHLWTQGEPIEARHWFPSYDSPNEKFTSEITCRVPEGMVVLSNGKRISETKDSESGLVAVRWLQDKPHVNYLICLVAGHLKKIEDKYKEIPLAFYTPVSQIDQAMNSFKDTKDMMGFFEQEIGVPYPWAKYYQVVVDDFTAGGMENTSLTVLTERTLHTTATETLRSSQGLVAHELAHQWFGNLVTCKDWANLWLNEGFATYYDALYEGHKNGREAMLYVMYQSAKGIINHPDQSNSIVRRDFNQPNEQFGYLAYPKGSWILHMLRSQLGEDLYRQCVKTYLERHQYGTVVTEDLNAVIEELSGRSWDQFFDQYVYHASQPELAVSYSWDERSKLAKLAIQQTQRLSERVLLFNVPLTVRFRAKEGNVVNRTITVKERAEDFYFSLPAAPEVVRVDPDLALLAKINFSPPTSMLYAQLAQKDDMLGRLIAAEQLGSKKEAGAVARLKEVLNNDPFYGVRMAASQALRSIGTDPAYDALRASREQSDARVRNRVVSDLVSFYREPSYATALEVIEEENNPEIRGTAIKAMGAYAKPQVREKLLNLLKTDSYQQWIAEEGIIALRAQDDARFSPPLLSRLKEDEGKFPSGVFSRGLEAVAFLARHEDNKEAVREFLTGQVNHKKRRVQLAAINALGVLGDPKAIAVLETFTAAKDSPERGAAERAINELRASRKPGAELGNLRGEVMDLQKENRELRKEIDDLKKRLTALTPAPPPDKDKKKPSSKPGKR